MFDVGMMGEAFQLLFNFEIFLAIFFGLLFGIITGAIPGFSTPLAISIMLPVTFGLSPLVAIVFLTAIYAGGNFGSSISAILLNVPGSPQAIVTSLEGYPMTKQGKANEALGGALASSAIGNLMGSFFLILVMPIIVMFALKFGAPELFMVAVLGLTVISTLHESFLRAAIAGLFGVLIGTIGMTSTGAVRGTYGYTELLDGVPLIPVIIGLIGFSELFNMLQKDFISKGNDKKIKCKTDIWKELISGFRAALKYRIVLLRSSVIGVVIGALPGAGATIASVVSYNEGKRYSKNPEKFGKGSMEGLVSSESANNASEGGALAIMLALGIPGGLATAVLIGALMLQGLTPGPRLFVDEPQLVYGIMLAQFFTSLLMIIFGLFICYYAVKVINIPTNILIPVIVVLSIVGTFAINKTIFDIKLMLIFAALGVLLRKYDFPLIAVVLGIILAVLLDAQLLRTYQTYGELTVIFTRPISLILVGLFVLSIGAFIYKRIKELKESKQIT